MTSACNSSSRAASRSVRSCMRLSTCSAARWAARSLAFSTWRVKRRSSRNSTPARASAAPSSTSTDVLTPCQVHWASTRNVSPKRTAPPAKQPVTQPQRIASRLPSGSAFTSQSFDSGMGYDSSRPLVPGGPVGVSGVDSSLQLGEGRRDRIRRTDTPVLPTQQLTRSHVPDYFARRADRSAAHHRRPVRPPGEVVRHVRANPALHCGPGQPERLRRDPDHGRVEVQPQHMIAFQPRLVTQVPAVGGRPPTTRQLPLPLAEIEPSSRRPRLEPHRPRIHQRHPALRTVLGDVADLELLQWPIDGRIPQGRRQRPHDDHSPPGRHKSPDMITWTPTLSRGRDSLRGFRCVVAGVRLYSKIVECLSFTYTCGSGRTTSRSSWS